MLGCISKYCRVEKLEKQCILASDLKTWHLISYAGSKIQVNTHCSVEDARATMALYRQVWQQWEDEVAKHAGGETKSDSTTSTNTEVEDYLDDAYWPTDV